MKQRNHARLKSCNVAGVGPQGRVSVSVVPGGGMSLGKM